MRVHLDERAPIHPTTDQLLDELRQTLARAEALWTDLAAILTGPVTVDLGVPADRGPVWTVPVSEVPVDGSVELRTCPPAAGGRFALTAEGEVVPGVTVTARPPSFTVSTEVEAS